MDAEMKFYKSLPPLVEGKIHGYLKFVIDEVIWANKSPGEIRVLATWWGENDNSQFRPIDIMKNVTRSEHQTTEIYAIRTNINLFEEYVKNCESIDLAIIGEETNTVIGTSQITDLLDIFDFKSCFKYISIITDSGNIIGELHISMRLEPVMKSCNMQLKTHKYEKQQAAGTNILPVDSFRSQKDIRNDIRRKLKSEENEMYKSILKSKRTEFQDSVKKFNNEVTDQLVAQVVARAQRLRGAILKETHNKDFLSFNDKSDDSLHSDILSENEAKVYENFFIEDMTSIKDPKTLTTFRSTSHVQSLIDPVSNSFKTCKYNDNESIANNTFYTQTNSSAEERLAEEKRCINSKETQLWNHIDWIRLFVESFTLSPAGYRRVKSSSLLNNDKASLSATYFIQYDMTFDHVQKNGKKSVTENRPIRICSKKQTNEGIYFNHDGVYSVSKLVPCSDNVIQFKIFVRHLNKNFLTELGTGTMYINDIVKNENWSIARRLNITNKGIKVGELNVIVELGSDSVHFEKAYIDCAMPAKTHTPILETQRLLIENRNKRSKSVAGAQSKTSSQASSVSTNEINYLTTDSDLLNIRDTSRQKTENMDDKRIDVKNQENNFEDKILLHGLIYVAEGKELPELNTYLICRAFWKEDKSKSQICSNTKNPFYQFCQLVPLIYGIDLLDRVKDNYIIIEVYYRNNNVDNLLGLAKLPVHQLYVAYRDPRVLPHLLLSKYPIVSVDGWVSIINPVTGQPCGQLLALVALGTAEQIALLEMSRGLRNSVMPQTISPSENSFSCINRPQNVQHRSKHSPFESQSNVEAFLQEESQLYDNNVAERESQCSNLRSQESQTDISTVKEIKFNKNTEQKESSLEHTVLHDSVGRLTHVLDNAHTDQAAQTDMSLEEKKRTDVEAQMCMNELNFNHSCDDSDSSSVRHHFQLPTEMYRSVGVGAEYDEEQSHSNYNNLAFDMPTAIHTEKESTELTLDHSTFRAVIEIECALHLPKIEKANDTVEPSTYVSFQANKFDPSKHLNSYTITSIFPHSCNPKWNWKCETKLPTDLLLHDDKRLILKIWRLLDAHVSMQVDLERDIVIGFSAIDLSILMNGFPTVSGWFHIMDFTGKCNGQIKVCITPLDNLSLFGKSTSTLSTTRLPVCNTSQLGWFPRQTHEMQSVDSERNNINYSLSTPTQEDDKSEQSGNQSNDCVPIGLEDASMSFLSLSLKQKLTELDEITKRLQSRLHDVTNAAFDDDFENEFDLNDPNSDNENNDCKNSDAVASTYTGRISQISQTEKKLQHNDIVGNRNQNGLSEREIQHYDCQVINLSGSPKPSCSYSKQNDNYQTQHRNGNLTQNVNIINDNFADYPERGTKTHINYLLDKLSVQFPLPSCSTKPMPMKRDIMSLLTNLQQNNNNLQESNKCSQEVKVCAVPTQTDNIGEQSMQDSENQLTNRLDNNFEVSPHPQSQISNKISTVIREELVAEENNDSPKYDELTSYLITSNVRHMDLNNIFNPLLYQHLVPDIHCSSTTSPDEEAIEQLDNRYSKAFNASVGKRMCKAQTLVEIGTVSPENGELFRMTPSGVSENVDDNIDVTVLHKSSYNDLLASNSSDSTTTISPKQLSKATDPETTENSYSISSETCVPALSRQAPDGGNPVEDITIPVLVNLQQEDDAQDSSTSSCN